jgi:hypothetical protein
MYVPTKGKIKRNIWQFYSEIWAKGRMIPDFRDRLQNRLMHIFDLVTETQKYRSRNVQQCHEALKQSAQWRSIKTEFQTNVVNDKFIIYPHFEWDNVKI